MPLKRTQDSEKLYFLKMVRLSCLNYATWGRTIALLLVFLVPLFCAGALAWSFPLVALLFVGGTSTGMSCSGSGVSWTQLRSYSTAAIDEVSRNEGVGERGSWWGITAAESDCAGATFVFVMRLMRSSTSLRPCWGADSGSADAEVSSVVPKICLSYQVKRKVK